MEGAAVALAMHAKGRPVKLRMTREEEFYTTFVRQGLVATIKMGMTQGRPHHRDAEHASTGTAARAPSTASTSPGRRATRGTGPYFVPNIHVDSYCVYTNHPVGGAMRGFGMPEIHFGIEQHIDQMAHKLGLDPVEVRLKNCLKDGDETLTGMKMHPTGLSQCIRKAADAIEWGKHESAVRRRTRCAARGSRPCGRRRRCRRTPARARSCG